MKPASAIVFDLDGTLVRLQPAQGEMDSLRADLAGIFRSRGIVSAFYPLYVELDRVLDQAERFDPGSSQELHRCIVETLVDYERRFAERSQVCNHALQAWHFFRPRARLGVVSNNTRECILRTLRMHGFWPHQHPPTVVGFEDVSTHKPAPDGLLAMATHLGLNPGDVVAYVADHVTDLEACRNANTHGAFHFVALCVRGGKCRWKDIAAHADFHEELALADLSGLPRVLTQVLPGLIAGGVDGEFQ